MSKKKTDYGKAAVASNDLPDIPGVKLVRVFLRFVAWKATPVRLREEKNQKEFAEAAGLHQDTLTDWKKHPRFWPLVREKRMKYHV